MVDAAAGRTAESASGTAESAAEVGAAGWAKAVAASAASVAASAAGSSRTMFGEKGVAKRWLLSTSEWKEATAAGLTTGGAWRDRFAVRSWELPAAVDGPAAGRAGVGGGGAIGNGGGGSSRAAQVARSLSNNRSKSRTFCFIAFDGVLVDHA